MEYYRIEKDFPQLRNSAVTIGKFDGIHRGHRKLVDKILKQKEKGAQAVILAIESAKESLFLREERAKYLESLGVDVLLVCPLDEQIRNMKAEDFVKKVLVEKLSVSYLVVGEEFRFGNERQGTTSLLHELGEKYGFEVEIIVKEMEGDRRVSSTYIREELKHGNMEKITSLLGRRFSVTGIVVHGQGIGKKKLLPTANLSPGDTKLMPPNGVYLTISKFGDQTYQGITNVGYKPTVGGQQLGVETYLFDCDRDLYGQESTVEFLKFLRPEMKFSSVEMLRKQMEKDVQDGKAYFEGIDMESL